MSNMLNYLPTQERQERAMRHGFVTPEEAFCECPECGPVIPHYSPLTHRWIKGTCECSIKRRQAKEQEEMRLAWMREQPRRTFEWLGKQWSDLPLIEKTFDTFNRNVMQGAAEAVEFFLKDMHGSLILHSEGYGTGKTHLLAACANYLRMKGVESRFCTAPKLFRAIQEKMDFGESYTPLLHIATQTPLLLLDDVDKAKPSEWKQELYFEIVDERTKRGLPTALSTNRISDLAYYVGGAACSRLSISQIDVDMTGSDYRARL